MTTNISGPQHPLFLLGHQMLEVVDVMCRGIDRGISGLIHADAAATRPGCTGSSGQRSVDPAGGER
jgi:hypothetical protein